MRIAHLLAPARAGGLERVVYSLAVGQHRRGSDVTVVPVLPTEDDEHPFLDLLKRNNLDVRPIVVPPRSYRLEQRELARIIQHLRPNVVHSHGYHTDVVDGMVVRRAGIPTVATAHGFTRGDWRNRFYEVLHRRALRAFDAVAAVSRPLMSELLRAGVPKDRLHFVPNAWINVSSPLDRGTARSKLEIAENEFVLGWVGRMTAEKGLDVLVDAAKELRDIPFVACVIGEGPERRKQEERIAAYDLADRFHWIGSLAEAGRYFRAFDVFVLSSRTEGLPMVLLESMAAGVPIVSTAVGGIPDVVTPREALLVRSENPTGLANAIRDVWRNRKAASDRASAAAVTLGQKFGDRSWLEGYEAVYRSARDESSRRRR